MKSPSPDTSTIVPAGLSRANVSMSSVKYVAVNITYTVDEIDYPRIIMLSTTSFLPADGHPQKSTPARIKSSKVVPAGGEWTLVCVSVRGICLYDLNVLTKPY